ncbi:hypothetical protein MASR2M15_10110 [Anaerolineales bacterium]
MKDWDTYINQQIESLIGDGNMSNHPLAGKALDLEDVDPADASRVAFKIMKDNHIIPGWMLLGQELETQLIELMEAIQKIAASPTASKVKLQARISAYNSQILSFNMIIPPGIPARPILDLEREIKRLQEKN